jgi:hypothetical protein
MYQVNSHYGSIGSSYKYNTLEEAEKAAADRASRTYENDVIYSVARLEQIVKPVAFHREVNIVKADQKALAKFVEAEKADQAVRHGTQAIEAIDSLEF